MDQQYRSLTQTFKDIESKFRGYVDQPQAPQMAQAAGSLKQLVNDASSKKHPRSIDDQIKRLISLFDEVNSESDELMDFRHSKDLVKQLERSREELRKFDNY